MGCGVSTTNTADTGRVAVKTTKRSMKKKKNKEDTECTDTTSSSVVEGAGAGGSTSGSSSSPSPSSCASQPEENSCSSPVVCEQVETNSPSPPVEPSRNPTPRRSGRVIAGTPPRRDEAVNTEEEDPFGELLPPPRKITPPQMTTTAATADSTPQCEDKKISSMTGLQSLLPDLLCSLGSPPPTTESDCGPTISSLLPDLSVTAGNSTRPPSSVDSDSGVVDGGGNEAAHTAGNPFLSRSNFSFKASDNGSLSALGQMKSSSMSSARLVSKQLTDPLKEGEEESGAALLANSSGSLSASHTARKCVSTPSMTNEAPPTKLKNSGEAATEGEQEEELSPEPFAQEEEEDKPQPIQTSMRKMTMTDKKSTFEASSGSDQHFTSISSQSVGGSSGGCVKGTDEGSFSNSKHAFIQQQMLLASVTEMNFKKRHHEQQEGGQPALLLSKRSSNTVVSTATVKNNSASHHNAEEYVVRKKESITPRRRGLKGTLEVGQSERSANMSISSSSSSSSEDEEDDSNNNTVTTSGKTTKTSGPPSSSSRNTSSSLLAYHRTVATAGKGGGGGGTGDGPDGGVFSDLVGTTTSSNSQTSLSLTPRHSHSGPSMDGGYGGSGEVCEVDDVQHQKGSRSSRQQLHANGEEQEQAEEEMQKLTSPKLPRPTFVSGADESSSCTKKLGHTTAREPLTARDDATYRSSSNEQEGNNQRIVALALSASASPPHPPLEAPGSAAQSPRAGGGGHRRRRQRIPVGPPQSPKNGSELLDFRHSASKFGHTDTNPLSGIATSEEVQQHMQRELVSLSSTGSGLLQFHRSCSPPGTPTSGALQMAAHNVSLYSPLTAFEPLALNTSTTSRSQPNTAQSLPSAQQQQHQQRCSMSNSSSRERVLTPSMVSLRPSLPRQQQQLSPQQRLGAASSSGSTIHHQTLFPTTTGGSGTMTSNTSGSLSTHGGSHSPKQQSELSPFAKALPRPATKLSANETRQNQQSLSPTSPKVNPAFMFSGSELPVWCKKREHDRGFTVQVRKSEEEGGDTASTEEHGESHQKVKHKEGTTVVTMSLPFFTSTGEDD